MNKSELAGKAQTVLGLIPAEDLGITLPHEHLLTDLSCMFNEPSSAGQKALAHQKVGLENLRWVHYHPIENLDNLLLLDEQVAISEAVECKVAGGNTIVEQSSIGLGRDPLALKRIALVTGLNIIMGCGYYVGATYPKDIENKTEEEIAEEIVHDVIVGVENTGVHAGIIGEIGCTWPWVNNEHKVLRASACAQQSTGAPLSVHPGRHPSSPFEIVEILLDAGADINRTVICHIDRTLRDPEQRQKLAETGCYLEYDLFGWEGYYPKGLVSVDLPNDAQRINELKQLIAQGFLSQILISHDICMKMHLCRYGGRSYSHILENVVPLMREKGMPEEHIYTLLVENPKRLLQFV
jgi:phosphotriesterase-related protein